MLKNITKKTIELKWDGHITSLLPGQTCKFLNPMVEIRMASKYNVNPTAPVLEHKPEKVSAAASQVTVNPVEPEVKADTVESDPKKKASNK